MTFSNYAPSSEPDGKTYCAVHPTVESGLKCNKCGRYMCTKCVVRTPVGYRCRECVYQQAGLFYKATTRDQFLGAVVAFALSIPIAFVLTQPTFIFLTIILSLPAGSLIGEAVFRVMGRRKARYGAQIVVACIIAGTIIAFLPHLSEFLQVMQLISRPEMQALPGTGNLGGQAILSYIVPTVLFAILSSVTAATRVK